MAMRPYEGLLTAMVTPFRADGAVNEEAAVGLGRHLLANGSNGLVIGGATGESAPPAAGEPLAPAAPLVGGRRDAGSLVGGAGSHHAPPGAGPTRRGGG